MSPAGGAAPSASIHTDPDRARRVIAASRHDFDARYPGLKLAPSVGLICAYEEEDNIGAVLAAMPAEACGLALTTLVVVDGGRDATDRVSFDSGAITFVLQENLGHGYALRVGYALCIELGAQFVVTLDADGQNDPAEILRAYVSDETFHMILAHQDFQGRHYYEYLGQNPNAREQYVGQPWFALAEQFADDWDQTSFDPDYPTKPLSHFEPMVREVFGTPHAA